MKIKIVSYRLIAYIIIALFPLQIMAQESVANIYKIVEISKGGDREYLYQTSLALLKRYDQRYWLPVKKNDELYFNDILKLKKHVRLQINIKNKYQDGTITLLSDSLEGSGKYTLKEVPNGQKRVILDIIEGNAILDIVKNELIGIAAGLKTIVSSNSPARALYNVRSDSSGEIYLEMGKLTFPGNSKINSLEAGQIACFRDGQITKIFVPDIQQATEYNNFIKMNNSTIWKTSFWKASFWKSPGIWIGVVAVGIGTAILITKPWESGNNQVTGTIQVRWGTN